ncbi:hypothetical protein ACSBM8_12340 [Sphingomonas sp. ASY06-1R]|uniref:hypothetical protein n=1 Tax=Sphingomonas sp. ASY06-1R TaxID=3445771 RepID=UPI003FA250E2
MSRLWDTPEFWVRTETDELLREYPGSDARSLATSFAETSASYDGDPAFARDIVAELHKRADAGVRLWPEPIGLASLEHEVRDLMTAEGGETEDGPPLWWQRI